MYGKLCLLSCLVLLLAGAARGEFQTVGVYDPNDGPYYNQVDQSSVYSSHTGDAGPGNVIDLQTFQALIGTAFNIDAGGVVDAENGSMEGQSIVAKFGLKKTKSVTITNTSGSMSRGTGTGTGNRKPTNCDYHLKSQAGRWDPKTQRWMKDDVTSPCIDAGDPSSDWTAELWPHGKRINMGAYGGNAQASMSSSTVGNIADLNNDNTVSHADVKMLAERWLHQESLVAEDLDRNGVVSLSDFCILADEWLWQGS